MILFLILASIKVVSMKMLYIYPPEDFDMFTNCPSYPPQLPEAPRNHLHHNVDFFFLNAITNDQFVKEWNGTKEEAKLFILPVYCTQSAMGRCGNHTLNVQQMKNYLLNSKYFRRFNGSDHFIICDHSLSVVEIHEELPNIIIGHKESILKRFSRVAVGDTTYNEVLTHLPIKVKPLENRKFDFFFAARTSGREKYKMKLHKGNAKYFPHVYYDRHKLWCDYTKLLKKPENSFLSSGSDNDTCSIEYNKNLILNGQKRFKMINFTEGMEILADSRSTVSLTGDTPTTDRIFNAFETETVVQVLSLDLKPLLDVLPFTDIIPWKDIFYVVESDDFDKNPTLSLLKVGQKSNLPALKEKINLMRKYKDDVLWISKNSKSHVHTIKTALKERNRNVQEFFKTKNQSSKKLKKNHIS